MRDGRSRQQNFIWISGVAAIAVVLLCGTAEVVRNIPLGTAAWLITAGIELGMLLIAIAALTGGMPWLDLIPAAGSCVLCFFVNNGAFMFNTAWDWVQGIGTGLCAIVGTVAAVRERRKPDLRRALPLLGVVGAGVAVFCLVWGTGVWTDRGKTDPVRTVWAVPAVYDSGDMGRPGTVEQVSYETKAYATDGRTLTKTCWVYLPYGYDPGEQYNILYLMHGTGDREDYWLIKNEKNKAMLDSLIASGVIKPMIVVTPTFYVEDDCADDLDRLTYSFADELRNDLMPAVEGRYSTYAVTADAAGFSASRDHRAFAGLSRGAVTTLHAALCGSLDYFSSFGAFSGSRTDWAYYEKTIGAEPFDELQIDYLFMSAGNFDFAAPGQVAQYDTLVEKEDRLTMGRNTEFVMYPMRWHSQGNWHLALYNFLITAYGGQS